MGAPYGLLSLAKALYVGCAVRTLPLPSSFFLRVLRVFAVQSSTTKSVAELPSYE